MNWLKKVFSNEKKQILDERLQKTKSTFFSKIARAVVGKTKVDDEVLDVIEESLLSSDFGVDTTLKIISQIQERVSHSKYMNLKELYSILRQEIVTLIEISEKQTSELSGPLVIMVVGTNGVGKTTTIGKLAYRFKKNGKKVIIGAADTFRAAAVEQLTFWAEKVGVDIIKQPKGSDPASVVFDTLRTAITKKSDVVLIDTAGRLHNKINLMNELSKIYRVTQKIISNAQHEVFLVIDSSTGQNAFEQARTFIANTKVTGLIVTKLDGTAKAGMIVGISNEFHLPVKYVGLGEDIEDLLPFDKNVFVESFFENACNIK